MRKLVVLTLACLLGAARMSMAQTYAGESEFKTYCTSCHGDAGKGDGPLAKSLRQHPADLTQLSKKNDGTFPSDRVFKIIDGRSPVPGHVSNGSDMPVWGDVFAKSAASKDADSVKARIDSLVTYVQRLQEK